jgi:hypothetical protein
MQTDDLDGWTEALDCLCVYISCAVPGPGRSSRRANIAIVTDSVSVWDIKRGRTFNFYSCSSTSMSKIIQTSANVRCRSYYWSASTSCEEKNSWLVYQLGAGCHLDPCTINQNAICSSLNLVPGLIWIQTYLNTLLIIVLNSGLRCLTVYL